MDADINVGLWKYFDENGKPEREVNYTWDGVF